MRIGDLRVRVCEACGRVTMCQAFGLAVPDWTRLREPDELPHMSPEEIHWACDDDLACFDRVIRRAGDANDVFSAIVDDWTP